MKDKEKQHISMKEMQKSSPKIEEIEMEYKKWAVGLLKVRFDLKPEAFDEHHKNNYSFENCADCLWNKIKGSMEELLWLRENQLPKDSVVLSKEGYEKISQSFAKELLLQTERTTKEVVEKFISEIEFHGIATMDGVGLEYFKISSLGLREIAREQFNVEVDK